MGGFRVNGCGWADYHYPRKNLGRHYCKYCGAEKDFSLYFVMKHISVLFLPTIPLNGGKNAVLCTDCYNGWCVPDDIKDLLLSGQAGIAVESDALAIVGK